MVGMIPRSLVLFAPAVYLALLLSGATIRAQADQRAEKLRAGLNDLELVGPWIYDDIEAGFTEANRSGKPLLIVFR